MTSPKDHETRGRAASGAAFAGCLALVLALAACTEQETYPISGEECSPDDPVHSIDGAGCVPA